CIPVRARTAREQPSKLGSTFRVFRVVRGLHRCCFANVCFAPWIRLFPDAAPHSSPAACAIQRPGLTPVLPGGHARPRTRGGSDVSESLLPLALLVLGFLCQWLAWRVRLPAILFLLLTGILLGPALGLLDPDALFGELLFPLVSLGVAVILFEGSLGLRWSELRGVAPAVINLVSVGAL